MFLQQENCGSSELLADRSDAVPHLRRGYSSWLDSCISVGLQIGDLSIFHDRHGCARDSGFDQRICSELIDLLPQLGRELRLGGQRKGRESQNNDKREAVKQQMRSAHGILLG